MSTRIEPKAYDVARTAEALLRALEGNEKRELTVADAATLTGLPLGDCEAALIHLGGSLESRIRTTDRGELLFTFASLTRKRPSGAGHRVYLRVRQTLRTLADRVVAVVTYLLVPDLALAASANIAALGAVVHTLHVLLQIPLLPPVVLVAGVLFAIGFMGFVVVQLGPVLALVLSLLAVGMPIFVLVEAVRGGQPCILLAELVLVPICFGLAGIMFPLLRDFASGARHIISKESVERIKGLWRTASGFVLGPEPRDPDGLDDERRVVAYLRRHGGILTSAELMALFGCTRAEAESESTRVLADYGGDVVVTDEGAVVYRFDALMQSAGTMTKDVDLRPAWERETAPAFFGCSVNVSRNLLGIMALSLLGLWLHPALVLFPTVDFYASINMEAETPVELLEGFGAWPYVVPLLVLASRVPFHLFALATHRVRMKRFALLEHAFTRRGAVLEDPDTRELVATGGEIATEATDEHGRFHVVFPEIKRELHAARAMRRSKTRPKSSLGEVVFDTEEDLAD